MGLWVLGEIGGVKMGTARWEPPKDASLGLQKREEKGAGVGSGRSVDSGGGAGTRSLTPISRT